MAGFKALICWITGSTLAAVRPASIRASGFPVAKARAVAAPSPPAEAPVMRTMRAS